MRTASGRNEQLDTIVHAACAGDLRAFERLVAETSAQTYALAFRLVGNEHDARDIVQETYLRAYRSIGAFRGDSAILTWLHRITANCSSTHLAKRRVYTTVFPEDAAVAEHRVEYLPEEMASSSEDRRHLIAALSALPFDQRAVVVLHDVYDLSHDVIAAELGITRTAAKVRLHRARRRLRDLLFGIGEPVEVSAPRTPATARSGDVRVVPVSGRRSHRAARQRNPKGTAPR